MLKTAAISAEALANVIDQSVDCVKLLDLGGHVLWMNANGLCAMEIEQTTNVYGKPWPSLWPEDSRQLITDALTTAMAGETVRFEAFCPTARGTPRWWSVTVSGVHAPDGELTGYLAISRDNTEAELQRRALAIAADELRHRLKNTYAMVCGLLSTFAIGNSENETFARTMNSRLMGLSTAQSLFMTADMPHDVGELIPALVQPFTTPNCEVCTRHVEVVAVARGQADAIALVVGELAMNSAKHGALAHGGTIGIAANQADGWLHLSWDEVSVNPVLGHTRPGGEGLNLIELMVDAHRGTIRTDWGSHGPVVTMKLPIVA